MKFFDTHAHIGLIYDDPIEQLRVIQKAKQAGVQRIVSINNSLMDFPKVYNSLKSVPGLYHAVGVAPSEVTNPGPDFAATIEKYPAHSRQFLQKIPCVLLILFRFVRRIVSWKSSVKSTGNFSHGKQKHKAKKLF